LVQPAEHDPSAQTAEEQRALALAKLQAVPQDPQLLTSVERLLSQPFPATPSQFPKVPSQAAIAQVLAMQLSVALGRLQVVPHRPQLVTVLVRFTSQQSTYWLLQLPKPALQVATAQMLELQAGVPLATEQTVPQAPQAVTVEVVLVSQPLSALLSQLPNPDRQLLRLQLPPPQLSLALGSTQSVPQLPQLLMFVRMSTSQPFTRLPSQSSKPRLQNWKSQLPPEQTSAALG
jgi:hypothetical protein